MEINKLATDLETGFNVTGSIPIVGIASGILRITAAQIQKTAAVIMGFIGVSGSVIGSDPKWEQMTNKSAEHFKHGILNDARGTCELIAGFTIFGSLGLGAIQLASKNKFNPIVKYS